MLCASSVVALGVAGAAHPVCAAEPAAQQPTAAAAQQPAEPQLAEVVVTAEKRANNVQRTSLAMTVLGADELKIKKVNDPRDLNSLVPGVQIYPIQSAIQVSVRGIGSTFLDPRGDGAASQSLDGLYFAKPSSNGGGFYDIARVEVLKGPQGTLYGRNAAAGAVNVITNRPVNDYQAMLEVGAGDYGLIETQGMVNVPVNQQLALRAAFQTLNHDGYVGNSYYDANNVGARLEAQWTPTDKLSVFAEGNYTHNGGHGTTATYYPFAGVAPWSLATPIPGLQLPKVGDQDQTTWNAQLQINYDLGLATLTSITGHVSEDTRLVSPNGFVFTSFLANHVSDWTQEIRLASNEKADHAGGLQWVVGGYYLNETAHYSEVGRAGAFIVDDTFFPAVPQRSVAAFGQVDYSVLDNVRLTAGVRYTKDDKGVTRADHTSSSASFNNVSYKVGAEWDVAPRHMLYADVATGYISGGVNSGNPALPTASDQFAPTFRPETITAYEAGSKNRFFGNRLQINADVYYYDFKHYQFQTVAFPNVGSFTSGIVNIGDVTTYGFEADGVFLLTPEDQFTASVALAHGQFETIKYPSIIIGPFIPIVVSNPSSSPLINLPEEQVFLGYSHTWRLPYDGELRVGVNTHYASRYGLIPGSVDQADQQKAYWMTDARATYSAENDRWEVELWVKNIENTPVNIYGEGPGFNLYEIEAPRTYGVTLRARFGGR
jgi:iron complex outermembrane receptor protein